MTDKELFEKCKEYGLKARVWRRKFVMLLPEVVRRRLYKKYGFGSLYEFCAKLAGMSHGQVDDALRVLRLVENKPALLRVIEQKGIHAVRPVATIANSSTAQFWADKAREMGHHTLCTYVREFKSKIKEIHPDHLKGNESIFRYVTKTVQNKKMSIDIEKGVFDHLLKLKGDMSWDDFFESIIQKLQLEKPESKINASRHIPANIKKYVIAKYNGKCAFPGCIKEYKILHHTKRYALTKKHDPDYIFPLCVAHERIAHHGLIQNEQKDPKFWSIKLNPDKNTPEFSIDQKVLKYRTRASP